ncbi:hypothetical protein [Trujillonella humicola]|uniref:hypothetical protein n=1 Tax=Trujillonella humicola TaxID=3383699 RepID=UPI0039061573
MTALRLHRVRALTSSLVEGVAVGAVLAGREHPPWSRRRVLTAAAAGLAVVGDQLSAELPRALRDSWATGEPGPPPPHERLARVHGGIRALGLGLLVQVLDRPVRDRLALSGVRRPHRWWGAAVALAHTAVLVPVHWRLAADRYAAELARDAAVEAELQRIVAGA